MSAGKVRRLLYRAGALVGDAQAVASGDLTRIGRRLVRKAAWQSWGRLARRAGL